jgi:hypothetical protein
LGGCSRYADALRSESSLSFQVAPVSQRAGPGCGYFLLETYKRILRGDSFSLIFAELRAYHPKSVGRTVAALFHVLSSRKLIEESLDHHPRRGVDQALADGGDGATDLHVAFIGDFGCFARRREFQ